MRQELSILIPIFNHDVVPFVQQLHAQAVKADIDFEILLFDDRSEEVYQQKNAVLSALPHVKIYQLPSKAGRSVARNFLAAQARFNYFLYVDCDSEMVDGHYLERYLSCCTGTEVVVCGGTAYRDQKPERDRLLRWTYGVKNETLPAAIRNRHPNDSFQAFNFLISKELFMEIRFNELLKNYGHEDTLFHYELTQRGKRVLHIDNPLYHVGIDTNRVYLEKTRQGVENLKILMESPESQQLISHMRLVRYFRFFQKSRTVFLIFALYVLLQKILLRQLNGRHPNMVLFNFYKLGYLCRLKYIKL
ncbi:MAG: glycosyltransferase [Bacteroidales bacterium]|nr:glycosyltransferase [Bacteroidales bacterium]